jgi:hypothetical protein
MSKTAKLLLWGVVALVLLGMICVGITMVYDAVNRSARDASLRPEVSTEQPHQPGNTPADGNAPALSEFGDGTWAVGKEIKAGTYVATVPSGSFAFCLWERLSGFSGNPNESIEYGSGDAKARMRVTIDKNDVGFKTSGCGSWKRTS